ncbi:MAG: metallopeptidase family protein [Lachnospiraceae bacterium]|nr:metallopeptidase family protein [Lachnospiraceae bacterium]
MLTIEEVKEILADLVDELPEEIFTDLNGGIALLPNMKINPNDVAETLYTMGEYQVSNLTGRMIVIYYGSFQRVMGDKPRALWIQRLREVLRHEFTHHVEILAGDNTLEKWDKEQMARYRQGMPMEKDNLKEKK